MVNVNGARQRVREMYPWRGLTETYDLLKMHGFATGMQLRRPFRRILSTNELSRALLT